MNLQLYVSESAQKGEGLRNYYVNKNHTWQRNFFKDTKKTTNQVSYY